MTRIVVTGAAGFIGSNIVKGLNARGIDDIIAVDDLTEGDKFRNLADLKIADYLDASVFYSLFDELDGADGHTRVPAQAREVFDVTGAGDTVIATLAAMLACGVNLREAMPIANRAGGIVVGKFGTASVSYEELFE